MCSYMNLFLHIVKFKNSQVAKWHSQTNLLLQDSIILKLKCENEKLREILYQYSGEQHV